VLLSYHRNLVQQLTLYHFLQHAVREEGIKKRQRKDDSTGRAGGGRAPKSLSAGAAHRGRPARLPESSEDSGSDTDY
jgi:hypothetical protein